MISRWVQSQRFQQQPYVWLLAVLLITTTLAGCGGTAASSSNTGQHLLPVSLVLDSTPSPNDTGIYVALQKGWYRDQGLDLTLLPNSYTNPAETVVGTGRADFAISYAPTVLAQRALGLPLVSVAAIIQHNTDVLVTLASSGLDSIAKLSGKRYAGYGNPIETAINQEVLQCGGARPPTFSESDRGNGPDQCIGQWQI